MSIYDELKPTVNEIMGEFKQGIIQLVQITPASGPIDNPGSPTETIHTLDATCKGVSFKFVKDGLALSTDLMVVAAPQEGVTPSANDFMIIDGDRFKIIQDLSTPAAGTRVVWKFIVRKGG